MSATLISNPLPGEDFIGIEPQLLEQVDAGWLHRLSLFTGRALTATALQSEQLYRAGRLAILGQLVTQGTVKGLELSADFTAADPVLQIAPGYGICATGEDVTLVRGMRTTLGSLQVVDPLSGAVLAPYPNYIANPANTLTAGVLLLQPITGQVSGAAVDSGSQPQIVSGNLGASCDQDPEEYAFEDWQIVDGVRLVMVAWPSGLALPALTPSVSYRNRLVYSVFNAEMALGPDDRLPWDLLGVPLAVIAFDAAWKPLFVDRSAVVRAGGLRRNRYVFPAQAGGAGAPLLVQPALAQARVAQLAEQISATPGLTSLVPAFGLLPPCGVLPAASLDFTNHIAQWLPSTWTVNAAPVLLEEMETALLSGMTAQPLDATRNETVDLLIPLPDAVYDTNVLVTETLDPAFQTAVNNATTELAGALQHRKAIQQEANALAQVVTGASQTPPYDLSAGLTAPEIALRDAATYTPASTETFGTVFSNNACQSTDYQGLIAAAGQPPYTITVDGNGNPLKTPLPLFSTADMSDMAQNGIQHFINRINNKLSQANDLLDLAFLTAQSDIYRFRQYVLGATAATALAVSPIAAEIATGESAVSTAANLQNYLSSILPAKPVTTATGAVPQMRLLSINYTQTAQTVSASPRPASVSTSYSPTLFKTSLATSKTVAGQTLLASAARETVFVPSSPGSAAQPASTSDVTSESPLVGAQLNLRTLSIAERLANPPSQEGLFYALGNRIALMNLLADLEITIDDIPILVDTPPLPPGVTATTTTTTPPSASTTPAPALYPYPTLGSIRATADPKYRAAVFAAIETPLIPAPSGSDPDEASLFSTGIHVLEQHSQLLRAIEARVAQYNDFLTLCSTALSHINSDLPGAETLITQLDAAMAQGRQDLAFTTALLNDEQQRIANVNAQRAYTLANYVQVVAFTRPRTLETVADVPSRQLVPGNIANPVPACLQQQTLAIPPELREIVALLREAPVSWLPAISALLHKLERPSLLGEFAADIQSRAGMVLSQPARVSYAASDTGLYAPLISTVFSANQQSFTPLIKQRAAFQPAQISSLSWASQIVSLQNYAAIGDLISSRYVHAEVVNATSRLMQQISSVATCLYARANQALPIDRLAWAEFLSRTGVNIQLQSLAVLPNWNTTLDYVSRQQMQMLVDWLFLQIDSTLSNAVSFMSDVVRVAILLASDAPADNVISGAVTLAATPAVGGVIHLTLPSVRVSHGMYVSLYSSGVLAAQAVVSDLDSSSVRATVTQVYKTGVSLQPNDVAHFSAQAPVALAVRAFDS